MQQEQLQDVLDRISEVRDEQVRTTQAVHDLVRRLDTLNGSVGRHEVAISVLQVEQARREGRESGAKGVLSALAPAIWGFIGSIGALLLLSGSKLISVVGK